MFRIMTLSPPKYLLIAFSLSLYACGGSSSSDNSATTNSVDDNNTQNEESQQNQTTNETGDTNELICSEIIPGADMSEDYICAHNAVRATADPVPSPELENVNWDDNLADIARAYAEGCEYAHNPDRSNNYPGYVGENLFIITPNPASAETVVNAWGSEDQYYDYNNNSCQSGEMCGHYTQIVWRESTTIGCGTAVCYDIEVNGNLWSEAHLVVCNYSPGGNYVGERPY